MKTRIIILTTALIFMTVSRLSPGGFFTGIRNQEFIGARPMSLGETFVAIADDINAINWNPAGLPALDHLGVNSMRANLFGSDIGCNYLALSIPGPYNTSLGIDWMNISFSDNELEFGKNKFNFSTGYQPFDWLSFGINLKYLRLNAAHDKISQGTFYGWGVDWGVLYWPHPKLKFGLVNYDFTNTSLKGIEGPVYKRNLRFGAAYQLFENLLVAADLDDRFHCGTEWRLFRKLLALRAGLQQDFYTNEKLTLSLGFGLDIPIRKQRLRFDYGFTDTPTLPNTHRTSLSLLIDLFPQLVRIKDVKISPVYASFYKYHSENPIGQVHVDYKGKKELDCTISVAISKYAQKERTKSIFLPAKSTPESIQEISLNTVFSDSILYEPDNVPLVADIKISYMSGHRPFEEKVSHPFRLYRCNSIDWQFGAEQAAAFITPDDSIVVQFARNALSDEILKKQDLPGNERFNKAIRLFNAISEYGICYEEDRYSPYSRVYKGFDKILYPAQLLSEKHGDCDDLCVLFAALFESKNIPTALVSVPGHIFLLFNTGVHSKRAFQFCCADDQYVSYQNQLWLPLETTWVGRSFCDAWKKGVEVFSRFPENERRIINVHAAWQKYEPVAYHGKMSRPLGEIPQHNFADERDKIKQARRQYLSEIEKTLTQYPDSTRLRMRLAIMYAFQNRLKMAEKHFRLLLANNPNDFLAINNLGNLFFMKGKLDSAQSYYQKALKHAKNHHRDGITLNLGLLYAAADIDSLAIEQFSQVLQDSGDYERAGDLLGMVLQADDLAKSEELKPKKKISSTKVKQIIAKAEKKRKKKPYRKSGTRIKRLVNLGAKGSQPKDEIENVFFWAY